MGGPSWVAAALAAVMIATTIYCAGRLAAAHLGGASPRWTPIRCMSPWALRWPDAATAAEPAARHGVGGGLRSLGGMVRIPGSPEPPSPERRWQPMAVFPSGGTPGRKRGHDLHARRAARLLAQLARPCDGDARHGRRAGGHGREPLGARRDPGTFHDRLRTVDSRPTRRTGTRPGHVGFSSGAGSIRHPGRCRWPLRCRRRAGCDRCRRCRPSGACSPAGRSLARARLAACYKIAMGLTMGYMLILMV